MPSAALALRPSLLVRAGAMMEACLGDGAVKRISCTDLTHPSWSCLSNPLKARASYARQVGSAMPGRLASETGVFVCRLVFLALSNIWVRGINQEWVLVTLENIYLQMKLRHTVNIYPLRFKRNDAHASFCAKIVLGTLPKPFRQNMIKLPPRACVSRPRQLLFVFTASMGEKSIRKFKHQNTTDLPVEPASRPFPNQIIGAGIVEEVEQVLPDAATVFLEEIGCGVPHWACIQNECFGREGGRAHADCNNDERAIGEK